MNGFRDRKRAGDVLGRALSGSATCRTSYPGRGDVSVLGLVRGGVPVAARVAHRLGAQLDALVVRKLGVPWSPEVAFGALEPGGVRMLNQEVARRLDAEQIDAVTAQERAELDRRESRYRAGRPPLHLSGRVAILVDDGLTTGATAAVSVAVARQLGAARVVLAAPVGRVRAAFGGTGWNRDRCRVSPSM
jgi:putative phosphoribosyl transferase